MIRFLVLVMVLSCGLSGLVATGATAGAWPRERGTGFAAVAMRLSWPQDVATWTDAAPTQGYRTLYLEYGLTDRLALGLDLGRAVSGDDKTVVFLQTPLRDRETGMKIALQFGLGQVAGEAVMRPGLAFGWGRERGWIALDTAAEFGLESGKAGLKADLTWGRTLGRDRKLILQVQAGESASDPFFLRVAPSMVFPVTQRLQIEAGGAWGLRGDDSMGLKLGLWTTF